MRIHFGVAMTRKVFTTCDDAAILHTLHVGTSKRSYLVSVLTKGASMNNWILWIDIDIYYRCVVDVDIHHLALFCNS